MKKLILFILVIAILGCKEKEPPVKQETLFIYCGITMIAPMKEISEIFEQKHNIKVDFMYEGSSALKQAIETNKTGDMYLPGSVSYLTSLEANGTIISKGEVGHNKAAIFVHKGNPKKITKDLDNLVNPALNVVIAKADEGSIGKETKKILSKVGIYEAVVKNSTYLTIDSKGINQALKKNDADISINWKATAFFPKNLDLIESIDIDDQYAQKHSLVLAVIKYSKNPDLANQFLEMATSDIGKNIFKKYGFFD